MKRVLCFGDMDQLFVGGYWPLVLGASSVASINMLIQSTLLVP